MYIFIIICILNQVDTASLTADESFYQLRNILWNDTQRFNDVLTHRSQNACARTTN